MKRIFVLINCLSIFIFVRCSSSKKATSSSSSISEKWFNENLQSGAEQYKVLMQKIPEGVMPETFTDGKLVTCKPGNWIAGFYPGNLIFLFEATGDSAFYKEAIDKIKLMAPEQYNTSTHGLGFMMYCSYGNLYKVSPEEKYKAILLNSARSLSARFQSESRLYPLVGKFKRYHRI